MTSGDVTVRLQMDKTVNSGSDNVTIDAYIGLPDLKIDGPHEVGCFLPPPSYDSSHPALADLSHEECLVKCSQDGKRVATILNVCRCRYIMKTY